MTLQATLITVLNTSYPLNWNNIHTIALLYTDPGSGALIWQLVLASIFGALFYLRSFIRRIAALISNGRSGSQNHRQAVIDPQVEEKMHKKPHAHKATGRTKSHTRDARGLRDN